MAGSGSRVELYAAIRRDARAGLSGRALKRKHGVGYATVAAALESAWPQPRNKQAEVAGELRTRFRSAT
jgi:lambda repressor-like predicted transcriptional regulator